VNSPAPAPAAKRSNARSNKRSASPRDASLASASHLTASAPHALPAAAPRTARRTQTVPRDRGETERRIVSAVGQVLSEQGFGKLGINAIAAAAGVDKVLIYRYFGGLPQLLAEYAKGGDFWPTMDELIGDDPQATLALPPAQRYALFMSRFIDGLRARPLTLEILAAETIERNELTAVLEDAREKWGAAATESFRLSHEPPVNVGALSVLLTAGIQYLLVRSRKIRIYGGINLQTNEGWDVFKQMLADLAAALFKE
jgi:AcrR family transcriptional regulator